MKIRNTISAESFLERQGLRKPFKSILRRNLRWLEKIFGSQILFAVPDGLQAFNPDLFGALEAASELQRLGVIRNMQKAPKFPDKPFVHVFFTPVGKGRCWGQSFFDEEHALWSCIAEAVERHAWTFSSHFFEKRMIKSDYSEIKGRALDIFSLAGFSTEQKRKNPCVSFTEKDVFGWIPVYSLIQDRNILCPIQLVSNRYFYGNVQTPQNPGLPEKMLRWCVSTGLATGRSIEEATVKGLLEVIERDAFMITYLNKLSPPEIDLNCLAEQDSEIAAVLKKFNRYDLEVRLLKLPTDLPVHSFLCAIIDRSGAGPALSLGAKTGFEDKPDILAAITEAFMLHSCHDITPPKKIDPLKAMGQHERAAYWAKLSQIPKINFLFSGEKISLGLSGRMKTRFWNDDSSRRKYFKDKLDFLVRDLKERKYEACFAELSAPEVKKLGLRSVFAVVPELQPMHLIESIPYFGGKRLREVPLKFGYEPAKELNREPQPFP